MAEAQRRREGEEWEEQGGAEETEAPKEEAPKEAQEEAPKEEPKEAQKEAQKEAPKEEAQKEAPKEEAQKEAQKEAPKEELKEAPKEELKEAPKEEAPKEAQKEAPKEAQKEEPKEAPKEELKEAPKEAPKEAQTEAPQTPTRPLLATRSTSSADPDDDSPNMIVYRKIEDIVTRIQDETEGVPIRTVKSFMTKIPSVVTGTDIVQWLMKNLSMDDPAEAMHIGSLIAAQGYFFPISDHVLCLKDDGTFYRFQAPYFWPSNCWEPENTDYAIYLCKRTMQNKTRLELADYEAENLARLQRAFARKWEFIYMQAEAQVKIDRKKDKTERKILDSQERAFWDVHRPVPGCVNTTEMDIRKCRRMKNPHRVKKSVYGLAEEGTQSHSPVHTPSHHSRKGTREDVEKEILFLNTQLDRHCMKMSKVAESLISYTEQYMEYDPFMTSPEPSNPWTSDDPTFWDLEASKEPSQQRVKKWAFSLEEALKDPAGHELFLKFLESEFSSENLRFWLAVQDLKRVPQQEVAQRAQDIWAEFLAEGAPSSINLDSHSYERASHNLKDPGRYCYEDAQDHIYKLMKSDSYTRFLRSNVYQDLLMARKKPETEQGRRTSLEKFTRSVGKSLTGKRLTGLMQSS